MDHSKRFYRATGAPDGLVRDASKSLYVGRSLVQRSTFVEDNEVLADRTASYCIQYVHDAYVTGELDGLMLGDDSVELMTTRVVAALDDGYLREKLSKAGSITQPTRGVPEAVVAGCLALLRDYMNENPVDAD